jgi:hypothetical protein
MASALPDANLKAFDTPSLVVEPLESGKFLFASGLCSSDRCSFTHILW